MKVFLLLALVALPAAAQTNSVAAANVSSLDSNATTQAIQPADSHVLLTSQQIEKIREDCVQNRRQVCGKILKILPDGLVVDSGYTNLAREPLNRSWLVPGTVDAAKPQNVVEENQPDALCIGLVFLTDLPKGPGPKSKVKPKPYDYVNLEAYPTGQYTYTSVGDIQRTVRRFSASAGKAMNWKIQEAEK